DGDVCTEDRCDAGGTCRHFVDGYAGVDCKLAVLLEPQLCADGSAGANLVKTVDRNVGRARALVKKADGASPGKADRRLARAIARLDAIRRSVGRSRAISGTCRDALETLVEERRELIAGLRSLPAHGG
ncbi:MAG TPA: hypothetical protein VE911_00510, partial [Candidatus Nitrosopolaris sp.]|nr:hypothetical protein [Candidatus Nitrosopolaris sp.]